MSVITLLTDFGIDDEYVGVLKGVILSIHPTVSIVDISHRIAPQDISGAAYAIDAAYSYFPAGTIHVIVVDPGVGTERAAIALATGGHIFVAPDNGVLSVLLTEKKPEMLVRIKNSRYFLTPVSRTFHGRDIFAPVAAHLARGVALTRLGPALAPQAVVSLGIAAPAVSPEGRLCGQVVSVDRFGNLITNIRADILARFCPPRLQTGVRITIRGIRIQGISACYADAPPGTPLAIFGSRGCLEVAVNRGSARADLGAGRGDRVSIRCPD